MKLAIITCKKLPQGVLDDQCLFEALRIIGFEIKVLPWDADVDWSVFDAGLIRSVWDYHQRADEFSMWLEKVANDTQIINHPKIINWNKNKLYLAELAEFGISIAPTVWIKQVQSVNLSALIESIPANKYFLKPVVGADSSGTFAFKNTPTELKQAQEHLDNWLQSMDMMLQPYLECVESFGETSLIYFGGNFSHAVRKVPVEGDYRVQDTFGAEDVSYEPNAVELSLSKACLQFLNSKSMTPLYARFDFLHDNDDSIYLNEAELIEPSLFFNHAPESTHMFAQQISKLLSKTLI